MIYIVQLGDSLAQISYKIRIEPYRDEITRRLIYNINQNVLSATNELIANQGPPVKDVDIIYVNQRLAIPDRWILDLDRLLLDLGYQSHELGGWSLDDRLGVLKSWNYLSAA